jgi:phospholipid transport system substrate-binding protein
VTGSRTDVTGEIIASQGARNAVDFQLGIVAGLYRVQDITIDNVSMVVSYRSEIQAVLANHDGQLGALLTAMREER